MWVQCGLVMTILLFAVTAWFTSLYLWLLIPVMLWQLWRNNKAITTTKQAHWVMNSEAEWHRVLDGQVTPCLIKGYWLWPGLVLLSLAEKNAKTTHHFMVSRSKIPKQDFSRLILGVKHQAEPLKEIKS